MTSIKPVSSLYRQLDVPSQEIRLLVIKPGSKTSDIHCTLAYTNLISKTPKSYEAISYCWGDPTNPKTIILDGYSMKVTRTAEAALRRFRRETEERVVWLDALCINQKDFEERGAQVSIMGNIYIASVGTLIWLGEDDGTCSLAVALMLKLVRQSYDHTGGWKPGVDPKARRAALTKFDYPPPKQLEEEDKRKYGIPAYTSSAWDALENLFSRPWFTRMWVIQEAVFSKGWDQKAFCGDLEIPYVIIHVSAEWISYQRWSAFPTKRGLLPAITLAQARGEANHTTLEDLLLLTAHFQSTDPRDKLFALLGFAAECQRSIGVPEALQPNYLISASEAFARATRYFIESSQSLGVLSHIGIFSEFRERCESPDTEFPTWVPQWHRGKPLQRTVTLASFKDPGDWVHRPVPYSASDNSIFMKSGPTGSSKILGLQGFRLDRIKHVSPVITAQQYVDFSLVSVMWREYASKLVHYPTGESLLRSFSLTMLVDANIQHEVASKDPKHDADFASYLVTWDVTKLSNLGKEYHDALLLNSTKGDGHRYGVAASNATVGRSFCITESGWMGICPPTAKPGDLICILFGGNVLYLLRRKRGHSIFIGNCYIHGRMDGDAMREQIRRHSPAEAFELR